jgi:hypothetical protein
MWLSAHNFPKTEKPHLLISPVTRRPVLVVMGRPVGFRKALQRLHSNGSTLVTLDLSSNHIALRAQRVEHASGHASS